MLDRFVWGEVERISPEAPVPVVRITSEDLCLGGTGNVIRNIRSLGGRVTVCGVLGRDQAGSLVMDQLQAIGGSTAGIFTGAHIKTTQKTRVLVRPRQQQLVRLDHENDGGISGALHRKIRQFMERYLSRFDGIVISDYGKGVIHPELLKLMADLVRRRGMICVIDPKRENYGEYREATLYTPNLQEASEASGIEIRDRATLKEAGQQLLAKWRGGAILITRGQEGMSLFRRDGTIGHFPTSAREVFDVTGAGDTVVACCALTLAGRGSYEEAAVMANIAAGMVVGEVGTAAVQLAQLKRALENRGYQK